MNINQHSYLDVLGQINLDDLYIQQAFDYYHSQYNESVIAQQFILSNYHITEEYKKSLFIGYCDRTMGKSLPKCKSPEGAAIRGCLQRCGLVRATGHELFRGCIVFPFADKGGHIISATGYRIGRIRVGDNAVVYWHKPELKSFVKTGMLFAKGLIREEANH